MNSVNGTVVAETITPEQLHKLHESGAGVELIDVRTPAEYRSMHAAIARLVPLDGLDPRQVMETRTSAKEEPLFVICLSGARGEKARERFRAAGYSNVVNVAGGTRAWKEAGLPVVQGQWMLPLDRQIQTSAGALALLGFGLGEMGTPAWFWLSGFVGFGLVFAGLTGFCPLGWLIARMPWNQAGKDQSCCPSG